MNVSQSAGRSVRLASRRSYRAALLSAGGSAAFIATGIALATLVGREAGGLIICLGLVFAWDAWQGLRCGRRFRTGAVAEERVGSRLWKLEELGWLVEHDVRKGGGGNVDHLVHSPATTFVIETKAGMGKRADFAQARQHGEWAARRYGIGREIVPVLCLQSSKRRPELVDGVQVVGAPFLADLLLDRG